MSDSKPAMRDLGEKTFLSGLLPTLRTDSRFVNGFGHDASVLDVGLPGIDLVLKVDRAAKPIASINGWSDYRVWGRMAVTANCSDILAVGGEPVAFMLSVTVDADMAANSVAEIVRGASEECEARKVAFLGGDTKEGTGINIVGTALGTICKGRHFDRHRGGDGDLLVLAGSLGGFLGGYWTFTGADPRPDALRYMAEPAAAWSEGRAIAELAGVHSACDLSDGLGSSVLNVVQPGHGAILHFDHLPFHPLARESAETRGVDILPYAFGVGDWGILYAVDACLRPELERLKREGLSISIVGRVVPLEGVYLERGGTFLMSFSENEHFRHRMEDQGDYFSAHEMSIVARPISNDEDPTLL